MIYFGNVKTNFLILEGENGLGGSPLWFPILQQGALGGWVAVISGLKGEGDSRSTQLGGVGPKYASGPLPDSFSIRWIHYQLGLKSELDTVGSESGSGRFKIRIR